MPARQFQGDGSGGHTSGGGGGYSAPAGTGGGTSMLPGTKATPQNQLDYPVVDTVLIVLAATKTPQQCLPLRVPYGSTVRARATNGTNAGNVDAVFVGNDPRTLLTGQGTPLMPLDDVLFPVGSLVNVWAYGTAGDGVVVSITKSTGAST